MALTANQKGDVVTVTAAGSGYVLLDDHYIDRVEWDDPQANADRFEIQDSNGFTFLQGRANLQTVGQTIGFDVKRVCKGGVQVPTLTSGTLTIYLAKTPRNL